MALEIRSTNRGSGPTFFWIYFQGCKYAKRMQMQGRDGLPANHPRHIFQGLLCRNAENLANSRDGFFGRCAGPHDLDDLRHALFVTAADGLEEGLEEPLFPRALPRARDGEPVVRRGVLLR